MNESENYKFKLPSRDSEDIADINEISDNFRIADQILKDQEVELGKKIKGSVATEISSNSKSTEFPPASLVFEKVSELSTFFNRKIEEVKDEFKNENASQKDFISALDKRVTNLEQGIVPSPFETDNTVAYRKDVPSNALPFAEVEKIGGMTYKDGDTLRSAPVTEVESVGVNFLDSAKVHEVSNTTINDGVVYQVGADTNAETRFKLVSYNLDANIDTKIGTIYNLGRYGFSFEKTPELDKIAFGLNGTKIDTMVSADVSHLPSGIYFLSVDFTNLTQGSISWKDMMINKGSTALPYSPYFRNTLPISAEVQSLDGYGWGINESVYNYIDWEKKQLVKRVGRVDLGAQEYIFSASQSYIPRFGAKPNGACLSNVPSAINSYRFDSTGDPVFYFNEGSYGSAEEFKSAMAGVMLYYELATPIITDISDILSDDNFIGVEGNGTLTFKNKYEYDVPSEVTYQIKGANV